MGGSEVEEVRKHVKAYFVVFGALALLTVLTVAVSLFDLPLAPAVIMALLIATVKGSLVALFFMHLISEKKLIYAALVLTFVFFLALIFLPLSGYWDSTGS